MEMDAMVARFPALQDTLLAGLVERLPAVSEGMDEEARARWLELAAALLPLVYRPGVAGAAGAVPGVLVLPDGGEVAAEWKSEERRVKSERGGGRGKSEGGGGKSEGRRVKSEGGKRKPGRPPGTGKSAATAARNDGKSARDMVRNVLNLAGTPLTKKRILDRVLATFDLGHLKDPQSVLYYTLKKMEQAGELVESATCDGFEMKGEG